jgi:hypothetical protein
LPVSVSANSAAFAAVAEEAMTQQPLQHVVEVAAEDAAVGMQLVEDDPAQVGEERSPGGPAPEDAEVEHVGVRDDDPRELLADERPLRRRSVAVVDLADVGREPGLFRQMDELAALVLPQRLQGKEEEAVTRLAARRLFEDRNLEDERLAGGRGGRDQHVLTAPHRRDPLGLVRPQAGDAAAGDRLGQRPRQRRIELRVDRIAPRQVGRIGELPPELRVPADFVDQIGKGRG